MEDRKYFEMFVLFSFTISVGMSLASIGSVLPDLLCLWDVTLHTASILFLVIGAGTVSGIAVSSSLIEKLPAFIVLVIISVARVVTMFLFPYAGSVAFAGPIVFLHGAALGLSAVGSLHTTKLLWPQSAGAIYLVQSGGAFGATLSPLIEKPFLSDGLFTVMMRDISQLQVSKAMDGEVTSYGGINKTFERSSPVTTDTPEGSLKMTYVENMTNTSITIVFQNMNLMDYLNGSLSEASFIKMEMPINTCDNFITYLEYPFSIFGLYAIAVTVGLIICYRRGLNSLDDHTSAYTSIDRDTNVSLSCTEKIFISLMFLLSMLCLALMGCVSNLLVKFGIESDLDADLSTMSNMASVSWLFYSIGRIIPVLMPDRVRTFRILVVSITGMTAGVTILFLCPYYGIIPLWISMTLLGFFTGPQFSCIFTWTGEYVCLSSKIIAILSMGATVGFHLLPTVTGLVHDYFGTNSFIYSIAGISVTYTILFISITLVSRYLR
ncbi:major facilitator superfamily domain-containing protein 4A-like [Haliotis cracherodii]|uniref:major facilitator superfamily domain-containing protein 4A-like n=1 Tax=Haliotis cracherodii TaxID=6455 RepID=UPI0039E733DF